MTAPQSDERSLSELIALLDRRQYDPACRIELSGVEYRRLRDAALAPRPELQPLSCKHDWVSVNGQNEPARWQCSRCGVHCDPGIALSAKQERCEHGVWKADHCWKCNPNPTDTTGAAK